MLDPAADPLIAALNIATAALAPYDLTALIVLVGPDHKMHQLEVAADAFVGTGLQITGIDPAADQADLDGAFADLVCLIEELQAATDYAQGLLDMLRHPDIRRGLN